MKAAAPFGDDLTEYLVDHCYRLMIAAQTTAEQAHWCERMTHYVGKRSPERVREMEIERGLA